MDWHPVTSSAIEALAHDGAGLAVKFKSGHTYHYPGISVDTFHELRDAPSIMRALQQHVIGAGVKHTRLEQERI